jgi:hypothetical protein
MCKFSPTLRGKFGISQDNFEKKIELDPRMLKYWDNLAMTGSNDLVDPRLITFIENSILNRGYVFYKSLIRRRAVELGFYPYSLTQEEEGAVLSCLSFEEKRLILKREAVREKNLRLQKNLSDTEKQIVRRYCCLTYFMAGSDHPLWDPIMLQVKRMGKKKRAVNVFGYFMTMLMHAELVFEKPFYFYSKCERRGPLDEMVEEYVPLEELRERLFKRRWWEQE